MQKRGKKFKEVQEKVDSNKKYSLNDACDLVKKTKTAKFDESVDVAINLGVNPKHVNEVIRGTAILPHGVGGNNKIAVFAKGAAAQDAIDSGADIVGSDDLAKKIENGYLDFDMVISSSDMMHIVGRLGKILGPRGMMPNPKISTVTDNVSKSVKEYKNGKINYKTDKSGNLHCKIGQASFSSDQLESNLRVLIDSIIKLKPSTTKGSYLKNLSISLTMGPSIKLDLVQFSS